MDTNKQLWIMGILFLVVSSILFIVGYAFTGDTGILSIGFFVGIILFLGHQGFMWWVLYQFAITHKRMSNKLHLLNKVALGGTSGFILVYLIVAPLIKVPIKETLNPISSIIVLITMVSIIIYQENNTNNFFVLDLHKKTNQTKKELNQSIGFIMAWITINLLWLALAFHFSLNLFTFMYLLLLILQSSLTYTTYGQSKYWNFTYESVVLLHLFVLGMYYQQWFVYGFAILIGGAFVLRQWFDMEYKKSSKIIGAVIYLLVSLMVLIYGMFGNFEQGEPSQLLLYPLLTFTFVFGLVYMINDPKFYQKIFVK